MRSLPTVGFVREAFMADSVRVRHAKDMQSKEHAATIRRDERCCCGEVLHLPKGDQLVQSSRTIS